MSISNELSVSTYLREDIFPGPFLARRDALPVPIQTYADGLMKEIRMSLAALHVGNISELLHCVSGENVPSAEIVRVGLLMKKMEYVLSTGTRMEGWVGAEVLQTIDVPGNVRQVGGFMANGDLVVDLVESKHGSVNTQIVNRQTGEMRKPTGFPIDGILGITPDDELILTNWGRYSWGLMEVVLLDVTKEYKSWDSFGGILTRPYDEKDPWYAYDEDRTMILYADRRKKVLVTYDVMHGSYPDCRKEIDVSMLTHVAGITREGWVVGQAGDYLAYVDAESGKFVFQHPVEDPCTRINLLADGGVVFVNDHTVSYWDPRRDHEAVIPDIAESAGTSFAASHPDTSDQIAVLTGSGEFDQQLAIVDIQSGKIARRISIPGHSPGCFKVVGKTLIIGYENGIQFIGS